MDSQILMMNLMDGYYLNSLLLNQICIGYILIKNMSQVLLILFTVLLIITIVIAIIAVIQVTKLKKEIHSEEFHQKLIGPRGPQGLAGPKGDKGERGPQGKKGNDGINGKDAILIEGAINGDSIVELLNDLPEVRLDKTKFVCKEFYQST